MELIEKDYVFNQVPYFNILCGTAELGTGFSLHPTASYCITDKYSRKYLSVGLNPHREFTPSVCLSYESTASVLTDFTKLLEHLRCVKHKLVNSPGFYVMRCDNLQTKNI